MWPMRSGASKAGNPDWGEAARRVAVAAAAAFLLSALPGSAPHGGGDSVWYGTMLADMVAQTRAGVFPVWTGQSPYQFNGAVYPLRIAPAFHYLGALLDAATLHRLEPFALQNLLLILVGAAAIFSAYFCLARLLPRSRWVAAALAFLFLACPGVLSLIYQEDLYMSWTTAPLIPVAWFATVRSFQDGGRSRTLVLLGGSIGLCFWGHSPIALWMTVFGFGLQGIRLLAGRLPVRAWMRVAGGFAALLLVAAYPIGSVLLFPPGPAGSATHFQLAEPENIAALVREAFPGDLRPVSAMGQALGDMQLGYALWFCLGLSLFGVWRRKAAAARGPLACVLFALVLLLPVPRLNLALWRLVPDIIRNPTGNWPMNRLYLVAAGAVVTAAAVTWEELRPGWGRRMLGLALALGCLWSGVEAARFLRGSKAGDRPEQTGADLLRPENVSITRFSYLVFGRDPAYFSHGVVDPALEFRLLATPESEPFLSADRAALAIGAPLRRLAFERRPGPDNWLFLPAFRLEPGRRYLLDIDFADLSRAKGVLQLMGDSLNRSYGLPDYGEARSFGAGGRHSPLLALSTSRPAGETVNVRLVGEQSFTEAQAAAFGRATLLAYDPSRLPLRVVSWIPLEVDVDSPSSAWLETPRMFQPGYRARVNGASVPVRPSREGLACVPVPAGRSRVDLAYAAPPGLRALFALSALSIAALAGYGIESARRRR